MDRSFKIQTFLLKTNQQLTGRPQLDLWFAGESEIELIRTQFRSPLIHEEVCAVRGKTAGAYSTGVTFQWTSAVQALSALLLKAAARSLLNSDLKRPLLEGGKGSMASSLDASLYKQTAWLDLFGSNIRGDSLSRRVLLRTNPGRRHFGPVLISLNPAILPPNCINVYINSKPVTDGHLLQQHALKLEEFWHAARGVQTALVGPQLHKLPRVYKSSKGSPPDREEH